MQSKEATILSLSKEIRDLCHFPSLRNINYDNPKHWEGLWVCLDTIDDTQYAINHYKELDEFNAQSGGYLFAYGVIQAFFVQQDAIKHLYEIIKGEEFSLKKESPLLFKIRECRNDIVGHPTKRGGRGKDPVSYCYISQTSLNKSGFQYMTTKDDRSDAEFITVDLEGDIDTQEREVSRILSEILDELKKKIRMKKEEFKKQLLTDLIGDCRFEFKKLYDSNRDWAETHFEIIQNRIADVRAGIIERYGSLNAETHLPVFFEKLTHIENTLKLLMPLSADFDADDFDKEKYYQRSIYIDAFEKAVDELKGFCKEIDEGFSLEEKEPPIQTSVPRVEYSGGLISIKVEDSDING